MSREVGDRKSNADQKFFGALRELVALCDHWKDSVDPRRIPEGILLKFLEEAFREQRAHISDLEERCGHLHREYLKFLTRVREQGDEIHDLYKQRDGETDLLHQARREGALLAGLLGEKSKEVEALKADKAKVVARVRAGICFAVVATFALSCVGRVRSWRA